MRELKWTRKKPTKGGFYWYLHVGKGYVRAPTAEITIIQVTDMLQWGFMTDALGTNNTPALMDLPANLEALNGLWAGPIKQPPLEESSVAMLTSRRKMKRV